jgi:hypothetical protein
VIPTLTLPSLGRQAAKFTQVEGADIVPVLHMSDYPTNRGLRHKIAVQIYAALNARNHLSQLCPVVQWC